MAQTVLILYFHSLTIYLSNEEHLVYAYSTTNLVNKRLIHEVWSANTQIQNVHLFQDGVVKSVKKP